MNKIEPGMNKIEPGMNKITEVTVTRLFGYEGNDYTVELLPDEPVTFIYGFNGIGKTTFLRLLDAALTRKFMVLDSILFESIQVKFDTDDVLTVRRTVVKKFEEITIGELAASSKDEKGFYFPIVYGWKKADGTELEGKYYFEEGPDTLLNEADSEITVEEELNKHISLFNRKPFGFKRFYVGQTINEDSSETQIDDAIRRIHVELLHANKDYDRKPIPLRLKNDDGKKIPSIFENFEKFDTLAYPYDDSVDILKQRFIEINEESDVTLSEFEKGTRSNYDKEEKYVLFRVPDKIEYLESMLKKYHGMQAPDLFDNCCQRFTDVINKESGLTDKYISIDSNGEISVKVRYGERDYPLDIKDLSSGEKNLLLLYFQLIFELPASWQEGGMCLQLLDEPEVSMHPDWLIGFVDNLKDINEKLGRGDNFQFVIATQSTTIAFKRGEMITPMRRGKNG